MRSPKLVGLFLGGILLLRPLAMHCEDTTMPAREFQRGSAERPPLDHELLTPANMGDKGFSITCSFSEHTIKKGTLPARPTGLIRVLVRFHAERGPAIRNIASVYVMVYEGDKILLSVPVQSSSYPRPVGVASLQFSIQEELLPKAELRLEDGRQGTWPSFYVDLHSFYKGRDKQQEKSD